MENNNLGLGDQQKNFQKIRFIVGQLFFFETPCSSTVKDCNNT